MNRKTWVQSWLRAPAATAESPQVKLEARRHAVSSATLRGSNNCGPVGPPAVAVCNTA